jgi:two-component system sensor histidine kinase HydH
MLLGYAVFSIIVILFIIFEIEQSRKDLISTVENESINLIHSLNNSIKNNYSANSVIESNILEKLNSVAAFSEHINEHHLFDSQEIMQEHNVDFIYMTNNDFEILNTTEPITSEVKNEFLDYYHYMINEGYQWLELGNLQINQNRYYILAKISVQKGFTAVGIFSDKLLTIRQSTGIGKLINDFAGNPGLEYIILQDTLGIFAASEQIDNMSSINNDDFLNKAYQDSLIHSRIIDFNNTKIYETVNTIIFPNDAKLLTRLAVSLEPVRIIQQRSIRRTIIFGIIILSSSGIILLLFRTREKVGELRQEKDSFESYLNVLLENINDAVIGINNSKEIKVFNKAAESLFKINYGHPQIKDFLFGKIIPLINKQSLNEIEIENFSDEKLILLAGKSEITLGKNDLITLYFLKDITELKKSANIIERQEKLSAMGQLAAGVAHEIRNPLNAINIITQRLQYEYDIDDDDYRNLTTTVRNEVARVNRIIEQFLDYTRPTQLVVEKVDIKEIIMEVYNLVESEAREKNIKVEKLFEHKDMLNLDKDKMKQVFLNLMRNSIQAVVENGKIDIITAQDGGIISILIKDTGKGIAPENIKKVFNPYFTTKKLGSGIGLSIVHKIITEHNGNINVTSEPGKQTVFKINLPAEKNEI